METVDLTASVGPAPATGDLVELSHEAFAAGCYVLGPEAQPRTALLHDWCVEWAKRGYGFCYVHPRGPTARELLARLPADRLDDIVWIDYDRPALADRIDVPHIRRVGVDPLAGPADSIDSDALVTAPAIGRSAGWVAAAGESERDFDWNVARVLDTVVPLLVGDDGPDIDDVVWWSVGKRRDGPTPPFEFTDGPAADRQLMHAYAYDAGVFRKVSQCLSIPRDPFPSNPLLGDSTYDIEDALTRRDIVVVSGALPAPDAARRCRRNLLGTHVLVQMLVRRLWEAAQTAGATAHTTPLLLNGVSALSPDKGSLVPELVKHAPSTPLAPVLAGPESAELPDRLVPPLTSYLDTRVEYVDLRSPGQDQRQTGDTEVIAQTIGHGQAVPLDAEFCCLVSTNTVRPVTADSPTPPARTARTPAPPRTRHEAATVAQAITDSVDRHGTIPDWLTDELLREAREG